MEVREMTTAQDRAMADRDEKIRRRAIWERSGGPEGTDEENWLEAAKQIDAELGEEKSPVHPETSGASAPEESALPDPFEERGVATPVPGGSPRPKDGGRSRPLKSR